MYNRVEMASKPCKGEIAEARLQAIFAEMHFVAKTQGAEELKQFEETYAFYVRSYYSCRSIKQAKALHHEASGLIDEQVNDLLLTATRSRLSRSIA